MRLIGRPGVYLFERVDSDMPNEPSQTDLKLQLFGWGLFIICALLFLASSIQNQDMIAILASLVFLVACFVFLYPLVKALMQK